VSCDGTDFCLCTVNYLFDKFYKTAVDVSKLKYKLSFFWVKPNNFL